MKKQIFAVCDLEAEYACNFMDYLNTRKSIPFEVQAFTSVESLLAYGKENPIELLLISAEAMCKEVKELNIGKIVILIEGNHPEEWDSYKGVYKYQSSADVVREVMACYGEEKSVLATQIPVLKKTTTLLGVYSPIGRCMKTSFAVALGQILARKQSVLYVNLEEYSGFEELLGREFTGTLGELLYYVRQRDTGFTVKLNSMIQSVGALDFIPPVHCAEDIRDISWDDWEYFLRELMIHSTYEVIILDIGNGADGVFAMLDMCSRVYMPVRADVMSQCKLRQFENQLKLRDYGQVITRLEELHLNFHSGGNTGVGYLEQLPYGPIGDYIRDMLRKDGI